MRYVLASRSPRRKELLGRIVADFDIVTKETDETLPVGVHPRDGVEILAVRKGGAVVSEISDDALVVSSDTLVEIDGKPLGKPTDGEDAVAMLLSLSGRTHNVHTGVAVHFHGKVYSGVDTAHVTFKLFDEACARRYVQTGEPMDKAGSYAIQGIGAGLVEKYEGEFEAIVGLGLTLTKKLIDEALADE